MKFGLSLIAIGIALLMLTQAIAQVPEGTAATCETAIKANGIRRQFN